MKKNFIIILLMIGGSSLQSQEVIDSVKFRISYTFSYKTTPLQSDYPRTDLMYLDIGKEVSKFYSRYDQIRDSIQTEGLKNNMSINEINSLKKTYTKGVPQIFYHLFQDNKFISTDRFVFLHTLYKETAKIPEWSIGNEEKDISGYTCRKAIAKYFGREWHVYFTSQIPLNLGPWKLWGLPGLILEASDKDNFFKYELHGFERIQNYSPIIYTHKNYDNKEYTIVDKNTFRKMERLYNEDNSEFMKVFLGVKSITATKPDGTVIEGKISIPYIPLEPW